jgi:hypothetical protein
MTTHAQKTKEEGAPPVMAQELRRMEAEPLLPVEKKLIGWSIGLGIALLGILVWVAYTYFPPTP